MARTIGAAIGVLIVVFFMATIASRTVRSDRAAAPAVTVSQR